MNEVDAQRIALDASAIALDAALKLAGMSPTPWSVEQITGAASAFKKFLEDENDE